jgi:hypothetical protein
MVNESLTTALAVALRPYACHRIDPGPHGECVEGSGRAGSARASGRGRRRELNAGGPFRDGAPLGRTAERGAGVVADDRRDPAIRAYVADGL